MKNRFLKLTLMLFIAACAAAFTGTPNTTHKVLKGLHEVPLGTTSDMCRSGQLRILNSTGGLTDVPSNGALTIVDVNVNSEGFWTWKCGSSTERSRVTECPNIKVTRLKVTHSNGRIVFRCFSHK